MSFLARYKVFELGIEGLVDGVLGDDDCCRVRAKSGGCCDESVGPSATYDLYNTVGLVVVLVVGPDSGGDLFPSIRYVAQSLV